MLRLGALEDGTFLEPEVGFCLHGLATSGGVMEAVCRVQVRRTPIPPFCVSSAFCYPPPPHSLECRRAHLFLEY